MRATPSARWLWRAGAVAVVCAVTAAPSCGSGNKAPVVEEGTRVLSAAVRALGKFLGVTADEAKLIADDAALVAGTTADDVARSWVSASDVVTYRSTVGARADVLGARSTRFDSTLTDEIMVAITCEAYDQAQDGTLPGYVDVFDAVAGVVAGRALGFDVSEMEQIAEDINEVISAHDAERGTVLAGIGLDRMMLGCPWD